MLAVLSLIPLAIIALIVWVFVKWSMCKRCRKFFTNVTRGPSPGEVRFNAYHEIRDVQYWLCRHCGLKTQSVPCNELDPNTGVWNKPPLCGDCGDTGIVEGIGNRRIECEGEDHKRWPR